MKIEKYSTEIKFHFVSNDFFVLEILQLKTASTVVVEISPYKI